MKPTVAEKWLSTDHLLIVNQEKVVLTNSDWTMRNLYELSVAVGMSGPAGLDISVTGPQLL